MMDTWECGCGAANAIDRAVCHECHTIKPDVGGKILNALAVPENSTNIEQLSFLIEAYLIFVERNARYQDGFRRSGWRGALFDMRKKLDRIWGNWWEQDRGVGVDDGLDLINYTVFFMRLANSQTPEARDGVWPWMT